MQPIRACHCCGLVQRIPGPAPGARVRCARCGSVVRRPESGRGNERAAASALAALILFPLAIMLPVMTMERFGHRTEASVWSGALGLLRDGEVFVGAVVFLCSVVLPLVKLGCLLAITVGRAWISRRRRAFMYRLIEWTGRWGMLDVLLISVVVAWVKLGDAIEVTPGPAALAFTLMVVASLFASAWFDPHALWEE